MVSTQRGSALTARLGLGGGPHGWKNDVKRRAGGPEQHPPRGRVGRVGPRIGSWPGVREVIEHESAIGARHDDEQDVPDPETHGSRDDVAAGT